MLVTRPLRSLGRSVGGLANARAVAASSEETALVNVDALVMGSVAACFAGAVASELIKLFYSLLFFLRPLIVSQCKAFTETV
jgi:hypothetical protein